MYGKPLSSAIYPVHLTVQLPDLLYNINESEPVSSRPGPFWFSAVGYTLLIVVRTWATTVTGLKQTKLLSDRLYTVT